MPLSSSPIRRPAGEAAASLPATRTRRRALLALSVAAGVAVTAAGRPLGAATGTILPVGHESRCDAAGAGDGCLGDRCDGCGQPAGRGSMLGSMLRGSFGHRRYCDGCGSAPQSCNPPIRRFVTRSTPATPAPSPAFLPPTDHPAIVPDDSYSPPAEPTPEPVFLDPTPVERLPLSLPGIDAMPSGQVQPLSSDPVPGIPPAAVRPADPADPVDSLDQAESDGATGLTKDPTAPPVPPESLSLPSMDADAPGADLTDEATDQPQKRAEPSETAPPETQTMREGSGSANPAAPPKPDPKPESKKSGDEPQPKATTPAPSRPIPPVDDDDIESGEFEVGHLPASGWITTEELLRRRAERPGLQFRGGEPDVGTRIYGAGKPFGLNR